MVRSIVRLFIIIVLTSLFGCTDNNEIFMEGSGPMKDGAYYVATWGDDSNPGTFEKPFASWKKGMTVAVAGDTVYFRGGVYYSYEDGGKAVRVGLAATGHNGTQNNPICFFNYPGENPVLDCSRMVPKFNVNGGLFIDNGKFINLKGLTVRGARMTSSLVSVEGISASNSFHITLENMTSQSHGGPGFRFHECDSIYFINCDSFNNCDSLQVDPGGRADGYWIYSHRTNSYILFDGCRSWNNSDDGFDSSAQSLTEFRNCWSIHNGRLHGEGNGFKYGWVRIDHPYSRALINCLAAFNKYVGFTETNWCSMNMIAYNNTSYANEYGFLNMPHITGEDGSTEPNRNIYRNNISYKNTKSVAQFAGSIYILDHNTWRYLNAHPLWQVNDSLTLSDEDFVSLVPTNLLGPRKLDGSLPDVNFLKIKSGSDLIGVGYSEQAPENTDFK
jgi:hypothetical protein